jgi:glycosyltransferase involved in cell wall biosynthesis
MTASPEPVASSPERQSPLDGRWRTEAERRQQFVLPSGGVAISCSAPLGVGGLGRHLLEFVDALERRDRGQTVVIGGSVRESDRETSSRKISARDPSALLARLPIPLSPGLRTRAFATEFDAYAAQRLPKVDHLIAFNGQALMQFKSARARCESLSLVSANSHLRRVARQHARAHHQYPLEGSWAAHLLKRNMGEYERADRIYVGSEYTRESFLDEGFRGEILAPFQFTPDPRYQPEVPSRSTSTFNVVYVGSLSVVKGVPLLIDAVRRLRYTDMRLALVGGWGTRGMRRFVQGACAEDSRISSAPGDPLPHLRDATLCVHPSYEDGFAYAPAEALACGVPVIVSEDTGMKELIDPGRNGLILPTGDLEALTEAIEASYRGELVGIG